MSKLMYKIIHKIPNTLICLIIIYFGLILTYKKTYKKELKEKMGNMTLTVPSIKKYVDSSLEGAIKSIRPDKQGPVGKRGIVGKTGSSGGLFTNKGPLRSISNPTFFIGRDTMSNGGGDVKIQNKTYMPSQIWIHSENGNIMSLYNKKECLNADNGTLTVSGCINANKWDYVGKTAQLQTVKPINGFKKCITFNNNPEKGSTSRYNISLEKCNISPEQAWSFY